MPVGFAVSVAVPVTQSGPLFVGPAVGGRFTVTVVVYTVIGLQPGMLTVREYVVVTDGDTTGFVAAEVNPPGPVHEKVVAPPDGFAVSVAVPVLHIGPLLVGAAAGLFTVTVVVYVVAGLQPALLTVSE